MFFIFYFIKSETSDSFVNHFDGHFAYLKTLDFKGSSPKLCTKSVTCYQNPKLQINLSTLTASEQVSGLWKQTKQHAFKMQRKMDEKGYQLQKSNTQGHQLINRKCLPTFLLDRPCHMWFWTEWTNQITPYSIKSRMRMANCGMYFAFCQCRQSQIWRKIGPICFICK